MAKKSKFEEVVVAIFRFILQNFGDLTTLILAGYIFISSNLSQLPTEALLTNIIGLLGLMAVSDLIFREIRLNKLEKISEQTNSALHELIKNPLSPYKIDDIAEDVENAHAVMMIGNTLRTSISYLSNQLADAVQNGLDLKIIMMDYRNIHAVEAMCNMYSAAKNIKTSQLSLVTNIDRACRIAKKTAGVKAGSFELGLFPSTLRYGMIVLDPQSPNGKIYLKLYKHGQGSFRPVVIIEKKKHPDWFDVFSNTAFELWKTCEMKGEIIKGDQFDALDRLLQQEFS